MAKKLDLDINTDSFLESIRPEMPPSSAQKKAEEMSEPKQTTSVTEKPKNGTKTAKTENSNIEEEYMNLFIREAATPARSGKMAYVRPEYHDRIMRITRVIGKNRLSLSAYLDHVLTHHFAMFEEAIRKQYKKNYEDVY